MKLWVATNWDEELLEKAPEEVEGFFGALPNAPLGAGRPSPIIPQVGKEEAASYIEKIHKKGFKFAYAMGAPCLGNREYTPEGYKEILEHFEWLCDIGVDYVIVSKPFLCELVKKKFPKLRVITSVIAHVNTVNGLKFWENLGADVVNLDFMINRDFERLEQIVDRANCELELLLNDGCLPNCPYRMTEDYPSMGHTHFPNANYTGFNYGLERCMVDKLSDPTWLLRSPWIRPEDLHEYERLGIERFKISGRQEPNWILTQAMKIYSERISRGNFLDVLGVPSIVMSKALYLDASALDGFLDFFKKGRCSHDCFSCKWCDKWAEKALKVDDRRREAILEDVKKPVSAMAGGSVEGFLEFNEQLTKAWQEFQCQA